MKNEVLYFSLYDFANSAFTTIIITFIFSTYFSQNIAPSNIVGQSYWGFTVGASGFLVAVLGPIIGSISDKKYYDVFYLRSFTFLCILTTCLLWFSKPSINFFYFTLVVVGIANFFYELSLIFYNSLLIRVTDKEKIGKSSGYGFDLGYLGGLFALLISIKIFIQDIYMVLGMILYEGVDLAYNTVRLVYNGTTGVYNWWYQVEAHEKEEQHQEAKEMIEELKKLNNRVKELENALVDKKQDIEKTE